MSKYHGYVMHYFGIYLQKYMGNQNNIFQLTETWMITTMPVFCKSTDEFVCELHNDFEFGASTAM